MQKSTRESGKAQASTLGSTYLRIRLMCRPVILDRVLANVLSNVPEFHLVEPSTRPADVVITTSKDATNLFDDYVDYPTPTKLLITIDRQQNVLYVRRSSKENTGIMIVAGDIPVLLDLLKREVANQQLPLERRSA
jgi:hypothetical protein